MWYCLFGIASDRAYDILDPSGSPTRKALEAVHPRLVIRVADDAQFLLEVTRLGRRQIRIGFVDPKSAG